MKVQIIDYGMGNLGSVKTAVGLLGFNADIISIPNSIESADKIILPGVGSFNDAMSELRGGNWIEAINEIFGPDVSVPIDSTQSHLIQFNWMEVKLSQVHCNPLQSACNGLH